MVPLRYFTRLMYKVHLIFPAAEAKEHHPGLRT
jgi:hypothetical protein